jgi:hypothetical protein
MSRYLYSQMRKFRIALRLSDSDSDFSETQIQTFILPLTASSCAFCKEIVDSSPGYRASASVSPESGLPWFWVLRPESFSDCKKLQVEVRFWQRPLPSPHVVPNKNNRELGKGQHRHDRQISFKWTNCLEHGSAHANAKTEILLID